MNVSGRWRRLVGAASAIAGFCSLAGCSGAGVARHAFWSPGSRKVALDVGGRLRVFDLAAGEFSTLDTADRYVVNPTYSPDGRKLAYYGINSRGEQRTGCGLWVRDLTTGEEQAVATDLTPGDRYDRGTAPTQAVANLALDFKLAGGPAWAPDSRGLAYIRFEGERATVAVKDDSVRAAREDAWALRAGSDSLLGPSWSPDGEQIAYLAMGDGQSGERAVLRVASKDGRHQRTLWGRPDQAPLWPFQAPVWSPDGTSLLAVTARERGVEARRIPVAGGPDRVVASFDGPSVSAAGSGPPALAGLDGADGELIVTLLGANPGSPTSAKQVIDRLADPIPGEAQNGPAAPGEAVVLPFPVVSPDGKRIAVPLTNRALGRDELRLYDLAAGSTQIYPIRDGRLVRGSGGADPTFGGPLPLPRGLRAWTLLGGGLTALGIGIRVLARLGSR
jgi:hypothetical protein